ncbi:NACHT, LRR and PYD domains-containing protein 12-like [Hoplias malabaricus]|uniref:NACHT, LRR and PYD domains-containing protein 12-like n=1 Tax=Hoplias malabaricus TaxID=27720 RepID=UPI0034630EE2
MKTPKRMKNEFQLSLNFRQQLISEMTELSSVDVLIMNLIKGTLLPSALIWITSRPAAASQIPLKFINRVTEMHGFSNLQKEEYFRKRISNQHEAYLVISSIKKSTSLHTMCQIPVFCWISAEVLQKMLKQGNMKKIPKTLTEMYINFLLLQTNIRNQKYDDREELDTKQLLEINKDILLKLSKLAFVQLMKGNLIFYKDDLQECSIDLSDDLEYSGICSEIFHKQSLLYQRKVYCFVHLSFQEFLAAFHIFQCYLTKDMNTLTLFLTERPCVMTLETPMDDFLKNATEKALQNGKGHLDLFLRFLLGISLDSNQSLLQGLLTPTQSSLESIKKTSQYIKNKIYTQDLSAEKSINLFLCLLEMNEQSLYKEIQESLGSGGRDNKHVTPGQCSVIAYMLQMSDEVLDDLKIQDYNTSVDGRKKLVPAVKKCRKALFAGCELTENCCESISAALQSESCPLRELDLSDNYRLDRAAELLSNGFKSSQCKLEILKLIRCHFTADSCGVLVSDMITDTSALKNLDLSYNDLQDPGLQILCAGLMKSDCHLETLRLCCCGLSGESSQIFATVMTKEFSSLRDLDLSNNDLQDSGVELLSAGLKCVHCKLEILRLSGCMVTGEGCSSLALALELNPFHLKELDLSFNYPGESGEKLLSERLDDPQCNLETLRFDGSGPFRIKPGLKKYACELTLNPNTAHPLLLLSNKNKKVTYLMKDHLYPDHPERFDGRPQVLCSESLCGRCYFEAEWSEWGAEVGVTYKGIIRKGLIDSDLSLYEDSWSLLCEKL